MRPGGDLYVVEGLQAPDLVAEVDAEGVDGISQFAADAAGPAGKSHTIARARVEKAPGGDPAEDVPVREARIVVGNGAAEEHMSVALGIAFRLPKLLIQIGKPRQ